VPSGIPYFFQALDRGGRAVQTMRSLTYVQPNQTLSCVGCHEDREATPLVSGAPAAATRDASKVRPEPEGSWPLRYDALVQPVLDKHCVSCHQPGYKDAAAAKFDLTPAKSYNALVNYANRDLHRLAMERDYSVVGDSPSLNSIVHHPPTTEKGHEGVRLGPEDLRRLSVWMDTYAHRQGAFSEQQEAKLLQLRRQMADLLDE